MTNGMTDVLIVDDESYAREGFRNIIDWESMGFQICGEAGDGEEALDKIRYYQPELILMDIRLPGMSGIDVLKRARESEFDGMVIILSGYSDFEYAREAIRYGAFAYLVKPVDGEELKETVLSVRKKLLKKGTSLALKDQYYSMVREKALLGLLTGNDISSAYNYYDLGFRYTVYQVVIYEKFREGRMVSDLPELLSESIGSRDGILETHLEHRKVVLLMGPEAIRGFERWIGHIRGTVEKNSPMDSLFFVYGETVSRLDRIKDSYRQCQQLIRRRFFCSEDQHMLSFEDLPSQSRGGEEAGETMALDCGNAVYQYILQNNEDKIAEHFESLRNFFYKKDFGDLNVRHLMIDLLFQVRSSILHQYGENMVSCFHSRAESIRSIETMDYYYEVVRFIMEEIRPVMESIGNAGPENIIDEVTNYIRDNYMRRLTLEDIAEKYGYNSAYMGKLFTARVGMPFNSYLEKVRIDRSMELLAGTHDLIQDVAAAVGYRYVDVFNQKFRKQTGVSPSQYRKSVQGE